RRRPCGWYLQGPDRPKFRQRTVLRADPPLRRAHRGAGHSEYELQPEGAADHRDAARRPDDVLRVRPGRARDGKLPCPEVRSGTDAATPGSAGPWSVSGFQATAS